MKRIFIGYDKRQPLAYTVARSSIERYAGERVLIEPLRLDWLPISRVGLTAFTYSRFLVPWLCNFEGTALFLDGDMIAKSDLTMLWREDATAAVSVVKNSRRFEWPSLMLFNCAKCTMLTPKYVDDPANDLYSLGWADSVGELPADWNYCVGYDAPNPDAKVIHYTAGIPCWPETKNCDAAQSWRDELNHAVSTVSWEALMGHSVHRAVVGK